MFYKNCFISFSFCFLSLISAAQVMDVDDKKPATLNGIEYGYIIKNEQIKSASNEEFSRFEITLYATNKSGCTKLYADRISQDGKPNVIATFYCNNANGKRLTAKGGDVSAKEFDVPVKVNDKTTNIKAGYIFRNGETVRNNIIVLIPKGDKPAMQCTVNYLPELQ
jgi:ATP-dependent protease Clp ATPase subunit